MRDYQHILSGIFQEVKANEIGGRVATYIPELAKVNPDYFGAYLIGQSGETCHAGDWAVPFSIQSVSKVFTLTLAYRLLGDEIWSRVGVEPSGTSFNSLVQLEENKGIPRNPFVNGGAIVIADMLLSTLENPFEELLAFVREVSGVDTIYYSARVANSEKSAGYRNVALCNLMKSFGNIDNAPDDVLDFYFHCCSIEMTCQDLASGFRYLMDNDFSVNAQSVLSVSQTKRVNAVMQTCGFYDESGEFAFKVGLPGKSGVGGGIIAVRPKQYSIATWSPRLNAKGNSCRGMALLELFTTATESSIF